MFTGAKMNIALIGLMGTGKTTVAKLLAKRLDKKLISTDDEIAKKVKTSLSKFVQKHGLEKFHEIESEIIENASDLDECVFDTGRGIAMRNENIVNLKRNALTVLLTTDAKTALSRLKGSRLPSVKKGDVHGVKDILQEHESRYKNAADYAIDTSRLSPEEVCDLIIHYLQLELK